MATQAPPREPSALSAAAVAAAVDDCRPLETGSWAEQADSLLAGAEAAVPASVQPIPAELEALEALAEQSSSLISDHGLHQPYHQPVLLRQYDAAR